MGLWTGRDDRRFRLRCREQHCRPDRGLPPSGPIVQRPRMMLTAAAVEKSRSAMRAPHPVVSVDYGDTDQAANRLEDQVSPFHPVDFRTD